MNTKDPFELYAQGPADAAEQIRALGGKLRCRRCGNEHMPSARAVSRYLQSGWPTCCGETMELVTKEKSNGER